MAITSNSIAPSNYYVEQTAAGLAFGNSEQGGVENVRVASFDYTTSAATALFTLPKGAIVTQVQLDINTAFDAGTTNTVDVGLGATADALVDGAAAGTVARLIPVQDVPSITPLTADTDVTVTYAQSGTAASAGAGYVWVRYIVVRAS